MEQCQPKTQQIIELPYVIFSKLKNLTQFYSFLVRMSNLTKVGSKFYVK